MGVCPWTRRTSKEKGAKQAIYDLSLQKFP